MFKRFRISAVGSALLGAAICSTFFVGPADAAIRHPLRGAPSASAPIVGWVSDPDCATIGFYPGGRPARRHVEGDGRIWYQVGDGWVLNTGWCI